MSFSLNPFKILKGHFNSLKSDFKGLMDSSAKLSQAIGDMKARSSDSPETEAIIERIAPTEDGEFILNSGLLTPEEIEGLSRLQLANFLLSSNRVIEMLGREGLIAPELEFRKQLLKQMVKLEGK